MAVMQSGSDIQPLNLPETSEYTHRAHRFPGKFHPPLIAKIFRENPEYESIADPMAGSGTVGVEAVARGKSVLCVDLDPLSCLMTRGKTKPVEPDALRNVCKRILSNVESFPEKGEVSEEDAKIEVRENLEDTPSVPPLNLFHWFDPYVAVGYSRLIQSSYRVLEIEPQPMRDAVRTALASMVRKISRADPQPVSGLEVTSVRRDQLENGLEFDVMGSFKQAVQKLSTGYEELIQLDHLGDCTVIEGDAREFSNITNETNRQPTMIITSPPYCNAIEYSRRHRLEYEWLGLFEGESLDEQGENRLERSRDFIGSHTLLKHQLEEIPEIPHEDIKSVTNKIETEANEPRKANLLRKYFLDAYDWLGEISEVLPGDGVFYMTIGPSTSYGERIETPQYLMDIARELALVPKSVNKYKLTNNKMQYPTNGPTTNTESLIEFRKE